MHSFLSQRYNLVSADPVEDRTGDGFNYIWPQASWVIFNNNSSCPNGKVIIALREIDGERLASDDPRRVEIELPFGLLAEYVGHRVCRDRMHQAEVDERNPRHVLGLADQGPQQE